MDLTPGSAIGPYTIEREIGRGGMGVVYLAHDARLDRHVAVKALPVHLAEAADRLARFEREARTLAQLNHPNVAGIYGLEEGKGPAEGHTFLILEYVPGETLADRLDGGALPVDEALEIAIEIAAGVEAAHEAGIIHRDLKPDNIKISPEGKVKVLDFGLAKAGESRSRTDIADAATATTPRSPTEPGAILGTAPYMSPEQARGRSLDKRSDIWSFGVMLYEMLTGIGPFVGETSTDSIGAILHKDVDFDHLPPTTPAIVRHLLALCLQRKRDDRLHDIADARIELQQALAHPGELIGRAAPGPTSSVSRITHGIVGALVGAITVGGLAFTLWPDPPAPTPSRRFELAPLEELTTAVISPDGNMIALIAEGVLHVRDMATGEIRELYRNEGDRIATATWSPDSVWIGFGTIAEFWRIRASGGPAIPIADDLQAMVGNAAWTADGEIVVCGLQGGLHRISVEGGQPVEWIPGAPDEIHLHPGGVLPDGRGALFVPHPSAGDALVLCVATPEGTRQVLYESEHELLNPVYSPTGHIVYGRNTKPKGIWAMPFSLDALSVTGDPFYVSPGGYVASVSSQGDLVFLSSAAGGDRVAQLTWVDREGNPLETVGPKMYGGGMVKLSPDGTKVVMAAKGRHAGGASKDAHLWIVDLVRGTATPLADEEGQYFGNAIWSPDGQRIAYPLSVGLVFEGVYVRNADGTGQREMLFEDVGFVSFSEDWSVAVMNMGPSFFDMHIVTQRVGDPESREVFQDGPDSDMFPLLRPGGGLVAYTSGNLPRQETEVFLRPFPSGAGRWQISTAGGVGAGWSPEGDRFFYLEQRDRQSNTLYEVRVMLGEDGVVDLGQPTRLFETNQWDAGLEVAPGSERFLVSRSEVDEEAVDEEEKPSAVIIENWASSFAEAHR